MVDTLRPELAYNINNEVYKVGKKDKLESERDEEEKKEEKKVVLDEKKRLEIKKLVIDKEGAYKNETEGIDNTKDYHLDIKDETE